MATSDPLREGPPGHAPVPQAYIAGNQPQTTFEQQPSAPQPGPGMSLPPIAAQATLSHSAGIPQGQAIGAALRPLPVVLADSSATTLREPDDDSEPELQRTPDALRNSPPWLISLVLHLLMLIVFGLILLPQLINNQVELDMTVSDDLGDQLLDDTISLIPEEPTPVVTPILTPDDLPPVDDPYAAPAKVDILLNTTTLTSDMEVPNIGFALTGREKGMKQALLTAYGGDSTTEAAVALALKWFARNQRSDGHWSLKGPFANASNNENQTAATAMALLAFQGAGHTHDAGQHKQIVAKGWKALKGDMNADGDFWKGGVGHHRLYSQAQATIAICELYGMTKDDKFKDAAQKAIDYAISIQDSLGGWRYTPGSDSDTSVTGWFVIALQSAMMAGLEVDSTALSNVARFLDTVAANGGSHYGYVSKSGYTPAMTAEGLLCRQYLGWQRDDQRMMAGVDFVVSNPINFNAPNTYYWYYATQVTHHMEGRHWTEWNAVMKREIPSRQVKDGKESGSWSPVGDRWANHGGRLYMTAMCTYMLEVYYRHLPIYSEIYRALR